MFFYFKTVYYAVCERRRKRRMLLHHSRCSPALNTWSSEEQKKRDERTGNPEIFGMECTKLNLFHLFTSIAIPSFNSFSPPLPNLWNPRIGVRLARSIKGVLKRMGT